MYAHNLHTINILPHTFIYHKLFRNVLASDAMVQLRLPLLDKYCQIIFIVKPVTVPNAHTSCVYVSAGSKSPQWVTFFKAGFNLLFLITKNFFSFSKIHHTSFRPSQLLTWKHYERNGELERDGNMNYSNWCTRNLAYAHEAYSVWLTMMKKIVEIHYAITTYLFLQTSQSKRFKCLTINQL